MLFRSKAEPGAVSALFPYKANARVPILIGMKQVSFRRETTNDPEDYAEDYIARTNSVTWRGYPVGTACCVSLTGESTGRGTYIEASSFAIDRINKFKQVARFRDPQTGEYPALTAAQLVGENGIKIVTVQGTANFNTLALPP